MTTQVSRRAFRHDLDASSIYCLLAWLTTFAFVAAEDDRGADESTAMARAIRVDPEVDSLIARADQLAARGEYELSATLWQKLLDESGHHLLVAGDDRYLPLREHVVRRLGTWPPEGRAAYRITADAEARGLLARVTQDDAEREVVLAELVRRFFLSSLGDDAALELAGLALDRRDFVTASRLTEAILQRYPDPSVSQAQVLLRQAVASAYLGDRRAAEKALTQIAALPATDRDAVDLPAIRQFLQTNVYPRRGASASSANQVTPASTAAQLVPQAPLPKGAVSGPMTESMDRRWPLPPGAELSFEGSNYEEFPVSTSGVVSVTTMDGIVTYSLDSSSYMLPMVRSFSGGGMAMLGPSVAYERAVTSIWSQPGGGSAPQAGLVSEEDLRTSLRIRWRERLWHPARQLLPLPNGLVFRTGQQIELVGADGGTLHTKWNNLGDEVTVAGATRHPVAGGPRAGAAPPADLETQLFGDRLALAMSACDDRLYAIESETMAFAGGTPASEGTPKPSAAPKPEGLTVDLDDEGEIATVMVVDSGQPLPQVAPPRNRLAAYDLQTRQQIWRRAATEPTAAGTADDDSASFLGPPAPWGDRLLVPVNSGGSLSLVALAKADGHTLWQTPLGDEPDTGCNPWSTSCVTIAGADAYVVLGTGLVYALDARTGALQWAVRYARDAVPAAQQGNPGFGGTPQKTSGREWRGWESNLAIVLGNSLVVMASDHDALVALDRRSGDTRWRSPRRLPSGTSVHYCLGVMERRLFVAGIDAVRAYDLPSGRLEWEQLIPPTTGRGVLTTTAIYLPIAGTVDGAILSLDPLDGHELAQLAVTLSVPEPLGNLYSDGQQLWVAGANRLYALTNIPHRLAQLATDVAANSSSAAIQRAHLLARLKRTDESLADARRAHELLVAQHPDRALPLLCELLAETKLPHSQPLGTLRLLADPAMRLPESPSASLQLARDRVIRTALAELQRQRVQGAAGELLALLPALLAGQGPSLDHQLVLIDSIARALNHSSVADDRPALQAAMDDRAPRWSRIAALPAFVRLGSEADQPVAESFLKSDDPLLRLTAAETLLRAGSGKTALSALVDVLDHPDEALRRRARRALRDTAGSMAPRGDQSNAQSWRTWLAKLEQDFDGRSTDRRHDWIDRILVIEAADRQLVEFDTAGHETWRSSPLDEPTACGGTAYGHRLAIVHRGRQIVEFDLAGQEIWRSPLFPWDLASVEQLDSGDLRVTCPSRDLLLEISPAGDVTHSIVVRGGPTSSQQLPDGRILVALERAGRVVAVTTAGEVVWEAADWNQVHSARRLSSGETLLVQTRNPQSASVDTTGLLPQVGTLTLLDPSGLKVVTQRAGIKALISAVRSLDGSLVLAVSGQVQMLAPDGTVLWTHTGKGFAGLAGY